MSQEKAMAFLSKVSEDDALASKVSAAGPNGWDAVAKAAGYDVTKEELAAASLAVHDSFKEQGGSLADEDLDGVVGGAGPAAITAKPAIVEVQGAKFNVNKLGKLDAFKVAAW
jgi:predicted ribosomally synthesized peptide with nif11-like leader